MRRHTQSTMGKCFTFVLIRVTKRRRNRSRVFSIFSPRCKRCRLVSDCGIHYFHFRCSFETMFVFRRLCAKRARQRRSKGVLIMIFHFDVITFFVSRTTDGKNNTHEKKNIGESICGSFESVFLCRVRTCGRVVYSTLRRYTCIECITVSK